MPLHDGQDDESARVSEVADVRASSCRPLSPHVASAADSMAHASLLKTSGLLCSCSRVSFPRWKSIADDGFRQDVAWSCRRWRFIGQANLR